MADTITCQKCDHRWEKRDLLSSTVFFCPKCGVARQRTANKQIRAEDLTKAIETNVGDTITLVCGTHTYTVKVTTDGPTVTETS